MIKIVHLIETLGSGGAEKQLINLIIGQKHHTEHSVIVLRPPLFFLDILRTKGINVIVLNTPNKITPRSLFQIYTAVNSINPDVIHTWLTWPSIAGKIVSLFRRNIQVLCSIQAPLYNDVLRKDNPDYSIIKSKCYQYIDALTAHLSKSIQVGCTEYVTETVCNALYIPQDRRFTIYNSSDLVTRSAITHNYSIVSVGRLVPEKGFIYLIQAMSKVVEAYPNAHLYIAGDGPSRDYLATTIEHLGLQNHITLLGLVKDIDSLYRSCNIFVSASLWEGFGVVVIEVISRGMPCIVSDIPAFREILGDNNIFFNPINTEQIANSIIHLFENKNLQQSISQHNYELFINKYSLQATSKKWTNLYTNIITTKSIQ